MDWISTEFEEHQVMLGYPDELVDSAEEASRRVVELMRNSVEPFATAFEEWIAKVDPESLRHRE